MSCVSAKFDWLCKLENSWFYSFSKPFCPFLPTLWACLEIFCPFSCAKVLKIKLWQRKKNTLLECLPRFITNPRFNRDRSIGGTYRAIAHSVTLHRTSLVHFYWWLYTFRLVLNHNSQFMKPFLLSLEETYGVPYFD